MNIPPFKARPTKVQNILSSVAHYLKDIIKCAASVKMTCIIHEPVSCKHQYMTDLADAIPGQDELIQGDARQKPDPENDKIP